MQNLSKLFIQKLIVVGMLVLTMGLGVVEVKAANFVVVKPTVQVGEEAFY